MKNNIILIGFMGCGKTSAGQRLAEKMSFDFCDTDELIEQKEKMTISNIFAQKGEDYFRKLETNTIREMIESAKDMVISTGGGLPLRKENADLLKELGLVVYLKTEKETILQRLKDDTTRPLLAGGNAEEKVETLLAQREPLYKEASAVTVTTDDKSFFQIVNEISSIYIKAEKAKSFK